MCKGRERRREGEKESGRVLHACGFIHVSPGRSEVVGDGKESLRGVAYNFEGPLWPPSRWPLPGKI